MPEQLKNAVLVMAAQDILVPPTAATRTEDQVKLWDVTFSVSRVIPPAEGELFAQGNPF